MIVFLLQSTTNIRKLDSKYLRNASQTNSKNPNNKSTTLLGPISWRKPSFISQTWLILQVFFFFTLWCSSTCPLRLKHPFSVSLMTVAWQRMNETVDGHSPWCLVEIPPIHKHWLGPSSGYSWVHFHRWDLGSHWAFVHLSNEWTTRTWLYAKTSVQ